MYLKGLRIKNLKIWVKHKKLKECNVYNFRIFHDFCSYIILSHRRQKLWKNSKFMMI